MGKADKPSWRDGLKGAMRSMQPGASKNPLAVSKEIKAVQAERQFPRPAESWGWYSKYNSKTDTTEVMIGKDGRPTTEYPHIHIIYDEPRNEIRIHQTMARGFHMNKTTLPGTVSPVSVKSVVDRMRGSL